MVRTLPPFYYIANRLLRYAALPLTRVRVRVEGLEYLPADGPLIVVFNHLSFLDPPLIGTYLPRDIVMMAKVETFEGNVLLRWVVKNYGAFPIRRGTADIGAIRRAIQVLEEGRALLISPEGTRSQTGQIRQPREGIALLATRTNAPILPVGLSGTEVFPERVRKWQMTPVTMSVGPPFRLQVPSSRPDRETLLAMSEAVMERIAFQVPTAYRGRFAKPRFAHFVREEIF